MVKLTGDYSEAEMEAFFRDTKVPVRLACHTNNGNPWIVTLWYLYRDGDLYCATSADAQVVKFLRSDSSVAFDVSTNDPPYCGVRGHGNATMKDDPDKAFLRDLLERYLDGTDSPLARRLLSAERDEVRVRISPERLHTWDYTERMRGSSPTGDGLPGVDAPDAEADDPDADG